MHILQVLQLYPCAVSGSCLLYFTCFLLSLHFHQLSYYHKPYFTIICNYAWYKMEISMVNNTFTISCRIVFHPLQLFAMTMAVADSFPFARENTKIQCWIWSHMQCLILSVCFCWFWTLFFSYFPWWLAKLAVVAWLCLACGAKACLYENCNSGTCAVGINNIYIYRRLQSWYDCYNYKLIFLQTLWSLDK